MSVCVGTLRNRDDSLASSTAQTFDLPKCMVGFDSRSWSSWIKTNHTQPSGKNLCLKKQKQRTKVSFMVWRKCSANSLVKRDVKTFACISCQLAACGNHTQRHNVLRKIMKLNPDYKKVKRPQRPKRRNISCYGWLVPVFWCRLAYTGNVGTKDLLFKLLETIISGTRTCSLLVETCVKG